MKPSRARRRRLTVPLVAGYLLLCAPGSARAQETSTTPPELGPSLIFDSIRDDVGESYQFGVIEHEYPFVNDGDRPVRILGIEPGDPRATTESSLELIPPGAAGVIRVVQPLSAKLGVDHYRYVVHTDEPEHPIQVLDLYTFVQSAYDLEHPVADFGDVDADSGKRLELDISTREALSLGFVRVVDAPPFVTVDPTGSPDGSPQTLRLGLELGPGAPIGQVAAEVHIQTDLAHQRDYVIRLLANVFGDIVPSPHTINWGAVRQGDSRELTVQLVSRSGAPIEIERVEDTTSRVDVVSTPCVDSARPDACRLLRLTLRTDRQGGFRGRLNVFLAGASEPLPLSCSGLVASPDARIQDLGVIDADTTIQKSVSSREDDP